MGRGDASPRACSVKAFAVLNPASGGGRTGRDAAAIIRRISDRLGAVEWAATQAPGAAAALARDALRRGFDTIIAIGGDGTLNETVNGFFENGAAINPEAALGVVMSGTGGDFRKTFGLAPGLDAALDRLAAAAPRALDVGLVEAQGTGGSAVSRRFLNIASFGLSGEVVRLVNSARVSKLFGGAFAFRWNSMRAMLGLHNHPLRLAVSAPSGETIFDEDLESPQIAICNGRYFGGGMHMAPDAQPDDGLFDIVVIAPATRREMLTRLGDIYKGTHTAHPKVRVLRGSRVEATQVPGKTVPALMEIDGEGGAALPARFTLLPGALRVLL